LVLTPSTASSQDLLQQGRSLYDSRQYEQAVTKLQQAAQQSGDPLQQALALSNLSLVHQELNQWQQAQQAIDQSLHLLQSSPITSAAQTAQALEVRGQLALSTGNAKKRWKIGDRLLNCLSNWAIAPPLTALVYTKAKPCSNLDSTAKPSEHCKR
jgi:tetratricopeptide (TPR) repeat protein